jgi:hypothetical protein
MPTGREIKAAGSALGVEMGKRNHEVASVADLVRDEPHVLPLLRDLPSELAQSPIPSMGVPFQLRAQGSELAILVAGGDPSVVIATVPGREAAPHDLDVLLRHRPRSIAEAR